jgi:hypothetical protein
MADDFSVKADEVDPSLKSASLGSSPEAAVDKSKAGSSR